MEKYGEEFRSQKSESRIQNPIPTPQKNIEPQNTKRIQGFSFSFFNSTIQQFNNST